MNPENGANEEIQTKTATETTETTETTVQAKVVLAEEIPDQLRKQIVDQSYKKLWLYVWLVVDDWKHFEDEQAYLRADGALEALEYLTINLGLADHISGAADEGRRRLHEHATYSRDHGPRRLEEIRETLGIMASASLDESHYDPNLYSRLQRERAPLGDDVRIAPDILRYLDGQDIEHA